MTWVLSVRPQRSLTREAGRAAHHQACDSSEEMGLLSLAEEQLLDVVAMCDFEDACALMEMENIATTVCDFEDACALMEMETSIFISAHERRAHLGSA